MPTIAMKLTLLSCASALVLGFDREEISNLLPKDFKHNRVVDYSAGHREGLPKFETGGRVMDIMNGEHFDDILRDTPDDMRPPAVVLFHSHLPPCDADPFVQSFHDAAENELPSRERLFIAKYNVDAAPFRTWYRFTPEMNLEKRFNVTIANACPTLAFVPRHCNGWTEWCVEPTDPATGVNKVGCDAFKEQCSGVQLYDPAQDGGDWKAWLLQLVEAQGEPKISPIFATYKKQRQWIESRQVTTTRTQERNNYMSDGYPGFSPLGYKPMPIPDPLWDWLQSFYKRNIDRLQTEQWDTTSTQLSFHETKTTFVDLDLERTQANAMVNKYLKPIVEEWTGLQGGLELSSFYGIRAYPPGSWLRNHVDRVDTHVISVTLSLGKLEDFDGSKPWPLEFVDWNGEHVRYDHPPRTMVLYESAKGIHGRPYRNEGGWHLGAFCHFRPIKNTDVQWVNISRHVKSALSKWVKRARYNSPLSVEPTNPVFTHERYGENGPRSNHPPAGAPPPGLVKIDLQNKDAEPRDVYWIPTDGGMLVFQGTMQPDDRMPMNSFVGHRFYFAAAGDKSPDTSVRTADASAILTVPNSEASGANVVLTFDSKPPPTCDQASAE